MHRKKITSHFRRTVLAAGAMLAVGVAIPATAWAADSDRVTIPSNYVYDTSLPNKTLHDYCSYSPDQPPVVWVGGSTYADFRGPCARHDMCYEGHLPNLDKASRGGCDDKFDSNLHSQCRYDLPQEGDGRNVCYGLANTYAGLVRANTWVTG